MQIVLIIILFYLLYRFVVGFVLPVATTASRIKKQFRDMQANQFGNADASTTEPKHSEFNKQDAYRTTSGKKAAKEDYIDFEEIPTKGY